MKVRPHRHAHSSAPDSQMSSTTASSIRASALRCRVIFVPLHSTPFLQRPRSVRRAVESLRAEVLDGAADGHRIAACRLCRRSLQWSQEEHRS